MTPPERHLTPSGFQPVLKNLATTGSQEARRRQILLVGEELSEKDAEGAGYGLRHEALSPMETLAQSISGACPTLTPFVTVPLVFTLAGNGTWLAYILATGGILLVAWCIGRFARYSSSPGSLYSYAAMILPPWLAATAAWSLLLAYVAGSASNIGGFLLLRQCDASKCHRPRTFHATSGDDCRGRSGVDRLARRKSLRALDAGDRSCFRDDR